MHDFTLLDGIRGNDHRLLSRVISHIENGTDLPENFFIDLYPYTGGSIRIGITGPPGAGKSTLVDRLIEGYRSQGKSVGIVAVDPTSPFTGGALLGDRVRMNRFTWDDEVFIRSMGSHGDLGGLARKAQDVADVLAASGKDVILFETVGVGQGEHDVAKAVDLTCVVLVPESGDDVQLMKAGLIEIANFFIINKSDRDGAGRLTQLLQSLLENYSREDGPKPPVINTVASTGEGIDELISVMDDHLNTLKKTGTLDVQRLERHRDRISALIREKLLDDFWTSDRIRALNDKTGHVDSIQSSPYEIANTILKTTNHEH